MKYAALLSALAATALAAPSRDLIARGHRGTHTHTSSTSAASAAPTHAATPSEDEEYNVSWAGAVLNDGATYTGVYGEFTVPSPKRPTVGETSADTWYVCSWVGIDGYGPVSGCDGLWQAGVDASVDRKGVLSYLAWYEWYPAMPINMDLDVKAGDIISVNLTRHSSTSGSVTMSNLSTGKKSTKSATSQSKICGAAAEWIMEDLSIDTSAIGLANFGDVTFRNAVAYTAHGKVSPKGAVIMDIEDKAKQILTSSVAHADSVVVTYV